MKNKQKLLIIVIFMISITLISGTLAYYIWQSSDEQKTNVVFSVEKSANYSCSADGGGNLSSSDEEITFIPSTCGNNSHTLKREIKVNVNMETKLAINVNFWIKVNKLGSYLANSENFKYAFTTSSDSCSTGLITTGSFNGKVVGDQVSLLTEKIFSSNNTNTYYLWIWLDAEETQIPPMDEESREFDFSLGGSCESNDEVTLPSEPDLLDGLIPVTISDEGVVTTVDSSSADWYDYYNQEWANAVLVKTSGTKTRQYYQSNSNQIVNSSDILAYYVWIPRYMYKIWSSGSNPQEIDIVFENKNTSKSVSHAVGEYYTHPAFTFGNTELNGIWVGKFETSQGTESNVGTDNPTILPDVPSWRYKNISEQFTTSLKFSGGTLSNGSVTYAGSDTYGLSNKTNSHMMKNSEWGAVAYLSHSRYGINREVYINNSSNFYTGRSGGNVGGNTAINDVYTDQAATDQINQYGYYTWDGYLLNYDTNTKSTTHDITKVASTTGNITGIYDMAGGSNEYVMGVLTDDNGLPRSGNSLTANSGFNGIVYDDGNNTEYTSGISFPTANYYDLYTAPLSANACNSELCYGHALSETEGWYGDGITSVAFTHPWFLRGDYHGNGSNTGIFSIRVYFGNDAYDVSWRSVLSKIDEVNYTYNSDGGTGCSGTYSVGYDSTYGTLCEPTKSGYTFVGWYNENDYDEYTIGNGMSVNDSNITYGPYASLKAGNYKAVISGSGLSNLTYQVYELVDGVGTVNFEITNSILSDNQVILYFTLDTDVNRIEIVTSGSTDYTYDSLKIYKEVNSSSIVEVKDSHTLTANWIDGFDPITSYYCSNKSVGSSPYDVNYTGNCTVVDDLDGNWRIKFLSSGTLTVASDVSIDVFLVGGGAGVSMTDTGSSYIAGSAGVGGGGGKTTAGTANTGGGGGGGFGGSAGGSGIVIIRNKR